MRLLLSLVELALTLPGWGTCLVAAAFVALFFGAGLWLNWKLRRLASEVVAQTASPLIDARVRVHSVEPTERPTGLSPFDVADDDEDYDPELDGPEAWQTEGEFYWIDAAITPQDPTAVWHASTLTLVPASWRGSFDELCESLGPLHTIELQVGDQFQTLADGEDALTGAHRLRLLMAAPEGHSHVKFAYFGATFGDFTLPAPATVAAR
jgi:hypothetical protein